jgi:hypothetical protein
MATPARSRSCCASWTVKKGSCRPSDLLEARSRRLGILVYALVRANTPGTGDPRVATSSTSHVIASAPGARALGPALTAEFQWDSLLRPPSSSRVPSSLDCCWAALIIPM